jgi:hypothetical protein
LASTVLRCSKKSCFQFQKSFATADQQKNIKNIFKKFLKHSSKVLKCLKSSFSVQNWLNCKKNKKLRKYNFKVQKSAATTPFAVTILFAPTIILDFYILCTKHIDEGS